MNYFLRQPYYIHMFIKSSIAICIYNYFLREHGAGSQQAWKKRAEARAQRHHNNLRINLIPQPPGAVFLCQCKYFAQSVWYFPVIGVNAGINLTFKRRKRIDALAGNKTPFMISQIDYLTWADRGDPAGDNAVVNCRQSSRKRSITFVMSAQPKR